jgi:hypothetical protein
VIVQVLLLAGFTGTLIYGTIDFTTLAIRDLYNIVIAFVLPSLLYFRIRQSTIKADLITVSKTATRFSRDKSIFFTSLNSQKILNPPSLSSELEYGAPAAALKITIVTHPICEACTDAFNELAKLLYNFPDDIKVNIKFGGTSPHDEFGSNIIKHLIKIASGTSPDDIRTIFHSWYTQKTKNFERWTAKTQYPEGNLRSAAVNTLFDEHLAWCKSIGIDYLPTILINDRKLPPTHRMSDLKYFIKDMVDEYSVSPVSNAHIVA